MPKRRLLTCTWADGLAHFFEVLVVDQNVVSHHRLSDMLFQKSSQILETNNYFKELDKLVDHLERDLHPALHCSTALCSSFEGTGLGLLHAIVAERNRPLLAAKTNRPSSVSGSDLQTRTRLSPTYWREELWYAFVRVRDLLGRLWVELKERLYLFAHARLLVSSVVLGLQVAFEAIFESIHSAAESSVKRNLNNDNNKTLKKQTNKLKIETPRRLSSTKKENNTTQLENGTSRFMRVSRLTPLRIGGQKETVGVQLVASVVVLINLFILRFWV